MAPRLDCRFYLGEKPCKYKCICDECNHFASRGTRILILKLGAIGDALRTTPILHALKRTYGSSYISWVTDRNSYPILCNNPLIDKLYLTEATDLLMILAQEFDILLSLDKSPLTTSLAMQVKTRIRRGYAMSPWGTLDIFNDSACYSLALGIDDHLKFHINKKTYQQTIYEIAEMEYQRDPYVFHLPHKDEVEGLKITAEAKLSSTGPKIGLNTGCGDVFTTKQWPEQHFEKLAMILNKHLAARVFLLGGPKETDINQRLTTRLSKIAVDTGVNSLDRFAGILKALDLVVTSDTMALHLALAVGAKVVGLFGATCHQEIDFYNSGRGLVVESECAPCYLSKCRMPSSCMNSLLPDKVFAACKEVLDGN